MWTSGKVRNWGCYKVYFVFATCKYIYKLSMYEAKKPNEANKTYFKD